MPTKPTHATLNRCMQTAIRAIARQDKAEAALEACPCRADTATYGRLARDLSWACVAKDNAVGKLLRAMHRAAR